MTPSSTANVLPGSDWKIAKRRPHCSRCSREFASGESHYSGIVAAPTGFERRDSCLPCWTAKSGEDFFSYWETRSPERTEQRIQNIQAMADFFSRLVQEGLGDPLRAKIAYLVSLLLQRRRKIRLLGSQNGFLNLEKVWNGETVQIPDPAIGEEELDTLKGEMERLFAPSAPAADPVPTP